MRTRCTLPFLLPLLIRLVSAVPFTLQNSGKEVDVWVTKDNTLNATTWNGCSHNTSTADTPNNQTVFNLTTTADKSGSSANQTLFNVTVSSKSSWIAEGTTNPYNLTLHRNNSSISKNGTTTNSTVLTNASNTTPNANTTLRTPFLDGTPWNITSAGTAGNRLVNTNVVGNGVLSLELVNRLPSRNVKAWVTGLDPNGALVMLGQDGSWVYPTTSAGVPQPITANVAIPLAGPNTTLPITLPGFISSSRIWIADGNLQFYVVATPNGPGLVEPAVANANDPNSDVNYAFAELSWGSTYGLYADISAVDFVGLPLGIQLVDTSNAVYSIPGAPANAAVKLCNQLTAQSKIDGRPWNKLCANDTNGNLVRVLSPNNYLSSSPKAFGGYYGLYVDDAWRYYANNDLIINTQTTAGNVTCRVKGALLTCAGDNRGYAKPTNYDIFGCNTGPFAILAGDNAVHYAVVPRLCAAFNRATLLVPGGNVQPSLPPSRYYSLSNRPMNTRPKNHYSELVHQMEVGGKGYAFSYDDVTPSSQEDQSGLVASTSPRVLRIIVGGA